MSQPEVITDPIAIREIVQAERGKKKTIGLVPTMGALHEGHLSLVKRSVVCCDVTIVTIFINPTQFNESSDFTRYPQDLDKDLSLLTTLAADYVFAPAKDSIYPEGHSLSVDIGPLGDILEGRFRPGHFSGVATILLKLFNIIPADIAFFGEKDYQQLKVTERLVKDANLPIRIDGCPTIREDDGLAMSSRNRFLPIELRKKAKSIYEALQKAQELVENGEATTEKIIDKIKRHIQKSDIPIEYVSVVDPETLQPVPQIQTKVIVLVAVRLGSTRLIDNQLLQPASCRNF